MRISHPQKTFWEASGVYRGLNVIDVEDFLVSNIPLPVGSCCTWRRKNFAAEANIGDGPKISNWMHLNRTFVLSPPGRDRYFGYWPGQLFRLITNRHPGFFRDADKFLKKVLTFFASVL